MKKVLVCVFAHPDDESFGPSGTIHKYTKTHDVYIICVTNGDAGENHVPVAGKSLGEIRQGEIHSSARSLGVKKVFFLNYGDATLNNLQYHEIAAKVKEIIDDLRPETLLTFEPRGISGHLDHIAVSMITSYVFEQVSYAKTILYFCHPEEYVKKPNNYFIYWPPGYTLGDIGKVVDVQDVKEIKRQAILKHKSQEQDLEKQIKLLDRRAKEHFLVITKE